MNADEASNYESAVGKTIREIVPDELFQQKILESVNDKNSGQVITVDDPLTNEHLSLKSLSIIGRKKVGSVWHDSEYRNIKSVEGIQYFHSLETLNISETTMTKFPEQIFENRLLTNIVITNNIKMDMDVEDKFGNFTKLKTIDLHSSGNDTGKPFNYPKSFDSLPELTNISLSNTGSVNRGMTLIPNVDKGGAFNYYNSYLRQLPDNLFEAVNKTLNFGYGKLMDLSLEEYDFFKNKGGSNRISNQNVVKEVNYSAFAKREVLSEGTIFKTLHEVMERDGVVVNVSLSGLVSTGVIDFYEVYDVETGNIILTKYLEYDYTEQHLKQVSLYIKVLLSDKVESKNNGPLQGSNYKFILNSHPVDRNLIYKDLETGEILGQETITANPGATVKHELPSFENFSRVDGDSFIDILFNNVDDIVVYYQKDIPKNEDDGLGENEDLEDNFDDQGGLGDLDNSLEEDKNIDNTPDVDQESDDVQVKDDSSADEQVKDNSNNQSSTERMPNTGVNESMLSSVMIMLVASLFIVLFRKKINQ